MKILHIGLSEYDSLEELHNAFYNMNEEDKKNGCQLVSSKKKAEENLKYQFDKFNTLGSRIFWYDKGTFEDRTTYVLTEAVFD